MRLLRDIPLGTLAEECESHLFCCDCPLYRKKPLAYISYIDEMTSCLLRATVECDDKHIFLNEVVDM